MIKKLELDKARGICYIDLLGLLTNPVGTILGPTGLGATGGGSMVPPPGSEMGTIASAYAANAAADKLNAFNSTEAEKQRSFESSESRISRDQLQSQFNSAQQYNSQEAHTNRQFQAEQVQKAQDYNTMMSNSAVQRRMEDLKKSGINPILAYTEGGASSPQSPTGSGSQASSGSGGSTKATGGAAHGVMSNIAEMLNRGFHQSVTSAMDQKRLDKDLDLRNQQILTEAEVTKKTHAEAVSAEQKARFDKVNYPYLMKPTNLYFHNFGKNNAMSTIGQAWDTGARGISEKIGSWLPKFNWGWLHNK